MEGKDFYLNIDGKSIKVTEEVYKEYRRAEDKERYFMQTLKKSRMTVNPDTQEVEVLRSREQSYEQLLEEDWQFAAPEDSAETAAVRRILVEELDKALHSLSEKEMALVEELFFLERTEREACATLDMAKSTLHRRKEEVLEKLRKKLEEI